MALSRSRRERSIDYWPGFVDALSTLVLGIIFLLTVFVVVQFYLSQEVSNKDTALQRLTARIAQITEILSLEQAGKLTLEEQMVQLRASLAATQGERDRYKGLYEELGSGSATAQGKVTELAGQLDAAAQLTLRQQAQIEVLNQQILALRRQLNAIEQALEASEAKDKESQTRILDLGARLNLALAQRVQELTRYRSDFFGRLSAILGNRPDIRIVGDRFVFPSEVFFDTGQAVLKPEGRSELDQIAGALTELDQKIPAEIAWVLRVDGHTDVRPVSGATFKSNWELSAARSISVVQYLISKGIAPQRLVAAGFGEFQPIDGGTSEEAYSRNRRIELKLTER
jgi:chemotaxis protein MotB